MDFEPREGQRPENAYPYSDYYSTGGRYRPPKRPRNYGWMFAVAGALLLCVAGGVAMGRGELPDQDPEAAQIPTQEAISAVAPQESQTPHPAPADGDQALGSGLEMTLSVPGEDSLTLPEIYQKNISAVTSITALSENAKATGTGIILSADGYILTNHHVVSGARQVTVLLEDGTEYQAEQVGGDETSDLAVLKIDAKHLTPAEFASSDSVQVGDAVVAIGDPLGTELRGTMTDGIICGLNRDVQVGDRTMTLLQTNAALNAGNSGGPLINMAGQVIGINTVKLNSNYTTVEGIGFAIPISTAKPIVDELLEKGYVSGRPAFGFTVEALSNQMRLFYNLPGNLCVRQVVESSDAYRQGIQVGDIITAIDGAEVSTMDEFNAVKNQFSAGDTVTLTVFRKGVELDVEVTLMERADLD